MTLFKRHLSIFSFLGILGITDSLYLTYQHYSETIPPCSINPLIDCGKVLGSNYSVIFGVPLAAWGAVHYSILLVLALITLTHAKVVTFRLLLIQSLIGALFSAYLVYLQLYVLGAICLYCMGSAFISFTLAGIAMSASKHYEHSKIVE